LRESPAVFFAAGDFLFPNFIFSCGLGGVFSNVRAIRKVGSSSFGLSLSGEIMFENLSSWFDPEDRWPKYAVGPIKHLHALGVISLNFSFYEHAMIVFFEMYLPKHMAKFMFDNLHNRNRTELVRELLRTYEANPIIVEHIEHSITHYSMCVQNRHTLLHSRPGISEMFGNVLSLEKQSHKNPNTLQKYQLSLEDLRQTADEMQQGIDYVLSIWRYWAARIQLAGGQKFFSGTPTASLPEKPPKPHIVSPHQPPSAREEPPGQLGPSQG
jgi:hypothetical protein